MVVKYAEVAFDLDCDGGVGWCVCVCVGGCVGGVVCVFVWPHVYMCACVSNIGVVQSIYTSIIIISVSCPLSCIHIQPRLKCQCSGPTNERTSERKKERRERKKKTSIILTVGPSEQSLRRPNL